MSTVLYVVYLALMIYGWLIVARALLTWFRLRPGGPASRLHRVLVRLTEPYLRLFQRIIPTGRIGTVGIDLSYIVGLIVLFILIQVVARA